MVMIRGGSVVQQPSFTDELLSLPVRIYNFIVFFFMTLIDVRPSCPYSPMPAVRKVTPPQAPPHPPLLRQSVLGLSTHAASSLEQGGCKLHREAQELWQCAQANSGRRRQVWRTQVHGSRWQDWCATTSFILVSAHSMSFLPRFPFPLRSFPYPPAHYSCLPPSVTNQHYPHRDGLRLGRRRMIVSPGCKPRVSVCGEMLSGASLRSHVVMASSS